MNQVYLALGSNLGNRIRNINEAFNLIKKDLGQVIDSSFLYETKPMYYQDQNYFLNCALLIKTNHQPQDLLQTIKKIEKQLGRDKKIDNGPREIDIDILFFNNQQFRSDNLQIPHKLIQERDFVLKPLLDINPQYKHPEFQSSIERLYNENEENNKNLSKPYQVMAFQTFNCNEKIFPLSQKALSMGIVNLTPDSFYHSYYRAENNNYNNLTVQENVYQKIINLANHFDIIDIGGESTRPNAPEINQEEELDRILPILRKIKNGDNQNVLLSLDTRKSFVAQKCMEEFHISMINDVSGGNYNQDIFNLMSENIQTPLIIMHSRGNPMTMDKLSNYKENIIEEIQQEIQEKIDLAIKNQIPRWNLIIDPGFGFAKTVDQCDYIVRNLERFTKSNYPLLVGFSNKRMIKNSFANNMTVGNTALSCISIQKGANILRIHDTEILDSINYANKIYRSC